MAENCFKELILKSSFPIVFRGCLDWEILHWNLTDWSNVFEDKLLPFRVGEKTCEESPMWERLCNIEDHTMPELIKFSLENGNNCRKWWYLDYKHIPEFVPTFEETFKTLSWRCIGFPDRGAESSTLWIGSSGAHTPCHYDTYGCNVVAQVSGRKRWLLFPPSESKLLKPTRIPYEESSVYSCINFSCFKQLRNHKIEKCYEVDLNPGDVLLVPPKWWHYVENLSLAISINMWINHANDDISRVEEALVRYFISSVTRNLPSSVKNLILNPNEAEMEDDSTQLGVIRYCKEKIKLVSNEKLSASVPVENFQQHTYHNHKYEFIRESFIFHEDESSLKPQNCCEGRLNSEKDIDHDFEDENFQTLKSIINAFCDADVISLIKDKL